MLISNKGSSQLDVVGGVRLELAHCSAPLFDHVEEHLRELRILIEIHQVGKSIVYFECYAYFLRTHREHTEEKDL